MLSPFHSPLPENSPPGRNREWHSLCEPRSGGTRRAIWNKHCNNKRHWKLYTAESSLEEGEHQLVHGLVRLSSTEIHHEGDEPIEHSILLRENEKENPTIPRLYTFPYNSLIAFFSFSLLFTIGSSVFVANERVEGDTKPRSLRESLLFQNGAIQLCRGSCSRSEESF